MKNSLFLFLLILLPLQLVFGQRKNDQQQMFLRAKSLYQQEQWSQAMEAFRELAAVQKNNSFAEYASFYYALSALNAGKTAEAKAMLQQIRRKFAGWDQQDEVSYWLAKAYLEEETYDKALEIIESIPDRRVKSDAEEMATHYLVGEQDIEGLKNLLAKNPNAAYLAEVLAAKISRQAVGQQDRDYLEQLVRRYNIDEEVLRKPEIGRSRMQEEYHVAALLPFLLEDMQPETNLHDRYFVLDLYEGMKIAREELQKKGINITLHAFDTRRDSLVTRSLLNTPEMKKIDLMVGPLFPGPSKVAADLAYAQGINMVNPLSVNPEVIQGNPYSFLFKPSLITQGRKAAEFAAKNFTDSVAVIIYGPKERDSIMAHSYKKTIEEKGFRVQRMAMIPAGEENRVKKLLLADEKDEEAMKEGGRLHKENLGHVFVASEDELIVANALSALMARGGDLPMIGHEGWLRKNFISYDQLERLGVYFVAPEYIDYASKSFTDFRQQYIERVNNMPSRFAYIGYDLLMFFGEMMHQYGDLFQNKMQEEPFKKGMLCAGFSYNNSNDNQCVPVVKFRDSALEVVYQ